MADDDKPPGRASRARIDDRDVRRNRTPPKGVAEGYATDRDRQSRSIPALQRDDEEEDAAPNEDIEDTSIPIPTGLSPVQEFQVLVQRAMSRSNLALSEARGVRAEMRAEATAMGAKFDSLAAQINAANGEMRAVSGVLNRQLEASQKQQELVLAAMLGAQAATNQAKIDEGKATGAHRRSLSDRWWRAIIGVIIGFVLAAQAWLFATK